MCHSEEYVLIFSRWSNGSKHVILVSSSVGSQSRKVTFKTNQEIQFIIPPKTIPRVVALLNPSTCFKRKRKASPIIEFKGEVGMCHSMDWMEMVDDEPNILEFFNINNHFISPSLIAIPCRSPKKSRTFRNVILLPSEVVVVKNSQSEFHFASS